jgi:hypothetical protein
MPLRLVALAPARFLLLRPSAREREMDGGRRGAPPQGAVDRGRGQVRNKWILGVGLELYLILGPCRPACK